MLLWRRRCKAGYVARDLQPFYALEAPRDLHLREQQIVYFEAKQDLKKLENKIINTTLTAWFNTNKTDFAARNILYPDFPKYYVWNNNKRQWRKRKKGESITIDQVYMAHQSEGGKYYLRMLLYFVPGAISFE